MPRLRLRALDINKVKVMDSMTQAGSAAASAPQPWVLQICHGYDGPFLDCARQYASLFAGTRYRVMTVYLTGAADASVQAGSASDEVLFLGYSSRDMRGLKLSAISEIRRLVSTYDFRLCIAHRFKPTYIACLATSLPVLGINHAFGVYRRRLRRLFATTFVERLTLVGVSAAVRDDIRSCLPGWPDERIVSLHNRIDIADYEADLLDSAAARAQLGLPADTWIVGNVGRLHPDKDQATLIRGFAAALPSLPPNSVLAIAGQGRLRAALEALAAQLGIAAHTVFLGQVPHARMYFRAFDVFALSSDHEPFGMVLLEAMVAGVPVVCTDCGGAPEIVEGIGDLVPLGRSDAMAECLMALSQRSPEQLDAQRSAMRQRLLERFSDAAAGRAFWSLPVMSAFTDQPG